MTSLSFADDVPTERVDPTAWNDIYVVGDVHGCRAELEALLSALDVTEEDLVVFVGDLVRKGPDSAGVVDLVRSSPNLRSVRGNNEEKLLRGEKALPELDEADLEWLASLPVAIHWADSLVVHGGIDPRKPLADHSVDDLQTARSLVPGGSYGDRPYWYEKHDADLRVFFGHTVLERPVLRENAIGLDTGCVYGGDLTAYNWRTGELTTVKSGFEERAPRSEDKQITPRGATAD